MTPSQPEKLIERLVADVRPVRPLRGPALRALMAVTAIALVAALAIVMLGDVAGLRRRYAGREVLLALETAAMLATAIVAITAAFYLSIPGRSKHWVAAPLPFLMLWLIFSGVGCYGDLIRGGGEGEAGDGMHCLIFILAISAMLAPWIVWRLSRALPIEPLPVALLGGLGIAATSAFILQFFHPFAPTVIDLAMHLVAILIVVGVVGLLHRQLLAGQRSGA